MIDPTFCCCISFSLQSESWVCFEQVHKACCDATLLKGTFPLSAGSGADAVQSWQ